MLGHFTAGPDARRLNKLLEVPQHMCMCVCGGEGGMPRPHPHPHSRWPGARQLNELLEVSQQVSGLCCPPLVRQHSKDVPTLHCSHLPPLTHPRSHFPTLTPLLQAGTQQATMRLGLERRNTVIHVVQVWMGGSLVGDGSSCDRSPTQADLLLLRNQWI